MTMTQRMFKFMGTKNGRKLERLSARWFSYSLMTRFYTRMNGLKYNHPLLLTTKGRKTGKESTVVLPWFEINNTVMLRGSVGGRPKDPDWARNIRKNPDVTARVYGQKLALKARLAEGAERAACWDYLVNRVPDYAVYQKRADGIRILPVIILERPDGKQIVRN